MLRYLIIEKTVSQENVVEEQDSSTTDGKRILEVFTRILVGGPRYKLFRVIVKPFLWGKMCGLVRLRVFLSKMATP